MQGNRRGLAADRLRPRREGVRTRARTGERETSLGCHLGRPFCPVLILVAKLISPQPPSLCRLPERAAVQSDREKLKFLRRKHCPRERFGRCPC